MSTGNDDTNFQSGAVSGRAIGVVVRIDEKDGMAYVRLAQQFGAQGVPDDKLSKYSVLAPSTNPQVRGQGTWPPHNLLCGSVVQLDNNSQRGEYTITGTVGAAQMKDKGTMDSPRESQQGSLVNVINALSGPNGTNYAFKQIFGNKNPYEFKSTMEAMGFINQTFKTIADGQIKNPMEQFKKYVKRPKRYGGAPGVKEKTDPRTPESMGSTPYNKANIKSAISAVQSIHGAKGELIRNSISMIQNVQKSVASGNPISAITAIGGEKVLAQAVGSVLAIFQQASNGRSAAQKIEELLDLELFLQEMYRSLTGQEPLDAEGKLTVFYLEWKKIYILTLDSQLREALS